MSDEIKQKIDFIVIEPYNERYCKYFVNDIQTSHLMKYDELYDFICNFWKGMPIKIKEIIDIREPYLIDIFSQELIPLKSDLKNERLKQLKKEWNIRKSIVNDFHKETNSIFEKSKNINMNMISSVMNKYKSKSYRD